MVKQKHHTARNQSIKNHKNGIKKPLRQRYRSMKGVGAVVFDLTNRLIPSSLETSVIRKSIGFALFYHEPLKMESFPFFRGCVIIVKNLS